MGNGRIVGLGLPRDELCYSLSLIFVSCSRSAWLSNPTERSPFSRHDDSWASQEITRVLLNSEVPCRIPNVPPLFPILSQINPAITFIIFPSRSILVLYSLERWLFHVDYFLQCFSCPDIYIYIYLFIYIYIWIQEMLAIIRCRIFCLPVRYSNI